MKLQLLASLLFDTPLMLAADKAEVIAAVFHAYASGEGGALPPVAPALGAAARPELMAVAQAAERFAQKPYLVTDAGVAVVPVLGPMMHRPAGLAAMSGGMESYQKLQRLQAQLAADPDVKGVLLDAETPGGQVAGAFATADGWAALATKHGKPVWAVANESAMSAGYLLASAAQRIVLPANALMGSVGVLALHIDESMKDAKDGRVFTPIFAGAKKANGSLHAPLAAGARADMQAEVDAVHARLVDAVAARRRMDPRAVADQEAGVFMGQVAVDAGLADEVMSFDDALAALEAHVSKPVSITAGFRQPMKGAAMAEKTDVPAGLTAEAVAAQVAAATRDGGAAMQARISGILTCDEAKGREALANHLAFRTGTSVEEAKAMLAAAPSAVAQAPVNEFAKAMAGVANPAVAADGARPEATAEADVAAMWAKSNDRVASAGLRRVK